MLDRSRKADEVTQISEKFGKAKAAFLVDYKGMTVEQVTALRKMLHPLKSEMRVVRNRLTKIALKSYPGSDSALSKHLTGTNAVVFAYEDASASAKAISEFAKTVEQLQIKSGVLDGAELNGDKIKYLATLPSKDVLRAQFLGVLAAPATKFVSVLNAVPSGFVRVLAAKRDKG